MTIEKVDSLPEVVRNGSGRNNEVFTQEVLDTLRNAKNEWHIVEASPWIVVSKNGTLGRDQLRKTRLNLYMRGKYARETYGNLETTVRTKVGADVGTAFEKQIQLFARAI